jgi:phage-related protein
MDTPQQQTGILRQIITTGWNGVTYEGWQIGGTTLEKVNVGLTGSNKLFVFNFFDALLLFTSHT